jgi:hypothetical protein
MDGRFASIPRTVVDSKNCKHGVPVDPGGGVVVGMSFAFDE